MRIAVLHIQNSLLSGAIAKYLTERGELLPHRITKQGEDEPIASCRSVNASVLLMDVSRISPFTLAQRKTVISKMKTDCPDCKIALLCDENADRETAEQVADLKKNGVIDGFFYSSVSGDYLSAVLESL